MDMKRAQSPNVLAHQPKKRAKIDIPSEVLDSLKSKLRKKADTAGQNARQRAQDDPEESDEAIAIFLTQLISAVSGTAMKDRFVSSLRIEEARAIVAAMESKENAVDNLINHRWETFLDLRASTFLLDLTSFIRNFS